MLNINDDKIFLYFFNLLCDHRFTHLYMDYSSIRNTHNFAFDVAYLSLLNFIANFDYNSRTNNLFFNRLFILDYYFLNLLFFYNFLLLSDDILLFFTLDNYCEVESSVGLWEHFTFIPCDKSKHIHSRFFLIVCFYCKPCISKVDSENIWVYCTSIFCIYNLINELRARSIFYCRRYLSMV